MEEKSRLCKDKNLLSKERKSVLILEVEQHTQHHPTSFRSPTIILLQSYAETGWLYLLQNLCKDNF